MDITITLNIEQALSVQGSIITKLNFLHRDLDRWKKTGEPIGYIEFAEEEIQNLEAAKAIVKEAILC